MQENKIQIYQAESGEIRLKFDENQETFWANQKQIADIFGVERSVVTKHIRNIYKDGEIDKKLTCAKIAQVQMEGKRKVKREIEYYNLDVILAVGYRVNSAKAIKFRQWATKILKDYIVKGYALNEKRLIDRNKRTGAFAFIWFLQKAGLDFKEKITPNTLTALTLLVAQSEPKEKDKLIGLILQFLK